MTRLVFLLALSLTVSEEFLFPTDPVRSQGGSFREEAEYPDYSDLEDYGDGLENSPGGENSSSGTNGDVGGLQTRFFFGKKDIQNLGQTAHNFVNMLVNPNQQRPPPAPRPTKQAPKTGPHGFPLNAAGNIDCTKVPRQQKRDCRKAKRQQRQGRNQGGAKPTEKPTSKPDTGVSLNRQTLQRAQRQCCGKQTDLVAFNKCCRQHGFCPICPLDLPKLAVAECCPDMFSGNQQAYQQCCTKYGQCPDCSKSKTPEPQGCRYNGNMFAAGSQMDKLAYKCMFVRCVDKGDGPETVLEYLDKVGCCAQGEDLFPPGASVDVDACSRRVCEDGKWVEQPSDLAAVFASRCPDGWLDLGSSCVYIWRELMTRKNASAACETISASLILPQNNAQLTQLIAAFNSMEDRDSTKELGGWVDAIDSGTQWQDSNGDTLTYQPWEEGSPDNRRATACAGLTVTSRSQGWKDYFCHNRQHMLYPICAVQKKGCGSDTTGCPSPTGSGDPVPPNHIILDDECQKIHCNADGYLVRERKSQCCYHHEWNGNSFGGERGWYPGVYPPGGFSPYTGLLCDCKDGKSDCSQFFDYGDYGEDYGEILDL